MRPDDVVVLIPARGGSKGIPGKNLFPLRGRPLIVHTIEQALGARHVNRVVVSTDDEEIATVSRSVGAEVVLRPANISGDQASSESALAHALEFLRQFEGYVPALVVFLQCTSPLRQPDDIDRAIETLRTRQADSLLSVSPSHKFLWNERDGVACSLNYDWQNRPRRQDMQKQYVENGSIYIFKPAVLAGTSNRLGGKIALHVMSEEASLTLIHRST
jgi:CMP-N,N'-diacetyllegionaminic acid synthase